MNSKNKTDRIIAVVCQNCGFAAQALESELHDLACPSCEAIMITEILSGTDSTSKRRNLRVVKPETSDHNSKDRRRTRPMTKPAKKHRPKEAATPPEPDTEEATELDHVDDPITEDPEEIDTTTEPSEPEFSVPETPVTKARTPFMTQAEVWTLYATVIECKSPDDIFDTFARTFEEKWMLAWWNNRVGLNELYQFYRTRDLVEFFRKCSHEIWFRMKRGELKVPEKAQATMWMWRLHVDVMKARDADRIFDLFGALIEDRSEMTWWLYKTNHGDLVQLGKGRDFIEYLRKVSHEFWSQIHKKK